LNLWSLGLLAGPVGVSGYSSSLESRFDLDAIVENFEEILITKLYGARHNLKYKINTCQIVEKDRQNCRVILNFLD